jgi:nicotinic acid mononucleotide adenylyltransferase
MILNVKERYKKKELTFIIGKDEVESKRMIMNIIE